MSWEKTPLKFLSKGYKGICLLPTLFIKLYDNNEKVDQVGLEEVLSFCIEEGH